MDDTQWKIMNAAIELIKKKGYSATTTKDIANLAKVNECTIFRKFKSKKDIVLCALNEKKWEPHISFDTFEQCVWELKPDLKMFASKYLENVTSELVKLSIGLRAPQIYEDIAPKIMEIPEIFKKSLQKYFEKMYEKNKIADTNFECLALMFLSMNFGFIFLKASFENKLTSIEKQEYIDKSVDIFVSGIEKI
ncbi:TetR/AcrR family transcriptional regulator [Clostridium sp. PL3]|uniref:TetR/AcrR family transcriptional regulator n=1 Tax=Clostridium thailandense TaxID=2794346 RepID=A0A949TXR5_9CLOT|nr:TetR/AcrR family transcriptional regulator [Clostridium thailandense]